MRLPFLWIALGFSLGIVAGKYQNIPSVWPASALVVGIAMLWFLRAQRSFLPLFVILLACAGILWSQLDAYVPRSAVQNFKGPERGVLRGIVDSLPQVKTQGKKVTVSLVLAARSVSRQERGRWRYSKANGKVQVFMMQASVLPQVGDELRLFGELKAPRQVLNPGGFDYGDFLAKKNIHAVFQTIGAKSVRIVRVGSRYSFSRMLAEARRYLATLINGLYAAPEAAILQALVLGLRSDVSSEVRSQFMKTGTIHLLAISGMNITMIAGTFYLMFLFCGVGFRSTAFVTLFIVIIYVGLAGAGIPIQRAGCGAVLVLVAALIGRPSHLLNALCFAFFAILVWNPQSFWSIGFQLSFLCVLSLILVLPLFSKVNAWTLSMGSSLAVLFGTFPVVLYYFNVFSPVSVLANIVAIPLCDAALFTALFALLFCGVPLVNTVLIKISSWIIAGSLAWVKCLSAWRWGYWFLEKPSLGRLAAYYASMAMILFFYKKNFPRKRLLMSGLILGWLSLTASFLMEPVDKGFEFTMLATGKNQVAHVRFTNGAHWLLNAGRNFPSDQGVWLIAPFLRYRGIQRLEGILLTDLSKKHVGGLVSVLRDFPARFLLYPGTLFPMPDAFQNRSSRAEGRKARSVQWGDKVLMADEKIQIVARSQKGSAFLIMSGAWRILIISRWDPEIFEQLLRNDESEIHAVFLPGSRQGIPAAFDRWLEKARPLLAVFPEAQPEHLVHLSPQSIPHMALKDTGALSFRRVGPRLELFSFLKGSLGFYGYI